MSPENQELLCRKLGKTELPSGSTKITLTMDGLCSLLDAVRAKSQPDSLGSIYGDMLDEILKKRGNK